MSHESVYRLRYKICAFAGLCLLVAFCLAALAKGASAESNYPNRQVRIVVAFAPGGIADLAGRLIGQALTDHLGERFYIENRTGAGGIVGAKLVSDAAPDGYTLLVTTTSLVIRAVASKDAVDPNSQLVPVAQIASTPDVFAVNKAVSDKTMLDFVHRKVGGQFTFATAGAGTLEHLTGVYVFNGVKGLAATHVPFSGGTPAVNAVLGQQVDMTVVAFPATMPFIKKDKSLRLLAVASHGRNPMIPDVPTLAEAGFTDLESASWISMFAPPNTPPAIARKLNAEVNAALGQAEVRQRLASLGFEVRTSTQPEFSDYIKAETKKWSEVVKATGFTLN